MQQEYDVRFRSYRIGGESFFIRSLSDTQQYVQPDPADVRPGISDANWGLFGVVWPSGQMLARLMSEQAIKGLRILEVGCGLGLASLVLQRRGADITASDHHPEMPNFLRNNTVLNDLDDIGTISGDWGGDGAGDGGDQAAGKFDLIIGSDLLYERGHHDQLSAFIDRHAKPDASVIIVDPNRGHVGKFNRCMQELGYCCTEERAEAVLADEEPYRGRILSYRRAALS